MMGLAYPVPSRAEGLFVRLPDLPSRGTISWSPVWGDYDNDGDVDLAIANGGGSSAPQTLNLYRNLGDGTFEVMTPAQVGSVVSESRAWSSIAWADIDNDNHLDLIASVWNNSSLMPSFVFRNLGNGTFHAIQAGDLTGLPQRLWADPPGDFNGDGLTDLIGAVDTTHPALKCFLNRGDGSFGQNREGPFSTDTLTSNTDFWADIDDDGDLDVFVSNVDGSAQHRDRLYLNDGHASFTAITNIPLVMTSGITFHGAWGDYDNDGDFDVVLCKSGPPIFFRNDEGAFVQTDIGLPSTAGGFVWVDLDNDALLDLYIQRGQGSPATNSILRNLGNGTFASVIDVVTTTKAQRQGGTFADLDNDGCMDLVEVSPLGGSRLFRNVGNTHRWLKLRLIGVASSTDAIGALVRVQAQVRGKTVWQMQHVGGGAPGQQDLRPNFGLGDASQADAIVIRWPSGNVQVLTNIAANQILTVTEDVNISPVRPVATMGGTVRITANTPGSEYQWSHEGTPLEGQAAASLRITNLLASQTGRYSVVVSTDTGSVTNYVYLRVYKPLTKDLDSEVVQERFGSEFPTWFDSDGDGKVDLFVPNSAAAPHDSFFRNLGLGRLAKISNSAPSLDSPGALAAAVGDYDSDGKTDIVIVRTDGIHLYQNRSDGLFASISTLPLTATRTGGISASWADYDQDGYLDLFVANGHAGLSERLNDSLYRGLPDGTFVAVTEAEVGPVVRDGLPTWSGVWFDADGDGAQDLLVMHGNAWPRLYHNNRDGTLTPVEAASLASAGGDGTAAVGDFDNDGRLDLFITRGSIGKTSLLRNMGDGPFEDVTSNAGISRPIGSWPNGSWVDYDNDGWLDLAVTSYDANALYRNRGDGTFHLVDTGNLRTDGENTVTAAWGDYDDNGFPDLLLSCGDSVPYPNHLYRNNGNSNHWLKVKLAGTTSNRSGIGAKVRVRTVIGGRSLWQLREISGNSAMSGAQPLVAHFGLGNASRATTVRVEWPSGVVQELGSITADQTLTLVEPASWKVSARTTSEGLRLQVFGEPNVSASLLEGTDLRNWVVRATFTTDGSGSAVLTLPFESLARGLYYRVRVP